MGNQLSVEASARVEDNTSRFLLIEGDVPFRSDIVAALRQRFPVAVLDYRQPATLDELARIEWANYSLILVSCPVAVSQQLSCLDIIKKRSGDSWRATNKRIEPLLVVMTDHQQDGRHALSQGADVYLPHDISAHEFSARLDIMLEVRRLSRRYPLALPEWHMQEVLHDSENAVIFLAENAVGEYAAIKRFKLDSSQLSPQSVDRFMADARALMLHHDTPLLVRLLDAGISHNAMYLVMEYLPGITLKERLSVFGEQRLVKKLGWFRDIVEALLTIHKSGLLHRDVKSSNVLMREDDSIAVLDLGVEGQLLLDCGFLLENEIYGTPFYISPERIVGEPASIQSDLYALGILFYEMLTGEKPYTGANLNALLHNHLFGKVPVLPEELRLYQPLLSRLMAKSPEARMASAQEVLTNLDNLSAICSE